MTEPDIDARLRTLLAARADQVEPTLSGPELRRLAATRTSGVPRIAAAVGAAAAVVVIAVATQHLGRSHAPQRGPAGHPDPTPSTSAPEVPAPLPTPVVPPRSSTTVSTSPSATSAPTPSLPRSSTSPTSALSSTSAGSQSTSVPRLSAPGAP